MQIGLRDTVIKAPDSSYSVFSLSEQDIMRIMANIKCSRPPDVLQTDCLQEIQEFDFFVIVHVSLYSLVVIKVNLQKL